VNATVVPRVVARQGPGGWIEMIARFGSARRVGGPGGNAKVWMSSKPPAVSIDVCA
jgi:hypothetical protein